MLMSGRRREWSQSVEPAQDQGKQCVRMNNRGTYSPVVVPISMRFSRDRVIDQRRGSVKGELPLMALTAIEPAARLAEGNRR
jgi:hypothetical protein